MEEVRVESWLELQERLFGDSWQESLGRFRSDYAFRAAATRTSASYPRSRGSAAMPRA